ncbi:MULTISPECIES: glycosyltransferase family 4 protein [Bacillaceae]|uniref:glycosyltransferase family 4 protein n=1 Tax=Bacillaceae TaxID=186817 RepID=UPI000C756FB6|nr:MULTISPECIES: glycosyltransferase family 4 protein [Bacillaceae]PLR68992.1 glycosyl transferase [Bacillus sp. UMB0893]QNG59548.1 glycosyltransferase family 4 protein [Bacillus sp. PAMC26568]
MKIALIATEKLPVPAIKGGAIQIYLDSIAPLLAQKHEVTILSIQHPDLPETETRNGVHYIRFAVSDYLSLLAEHIKNTQYDVIHLCNRPAWIPPLHAHSPNSRWILSVHNEMFANDKMTNEEGRACIAAVAQIVTVSDFIGRTITDRFPEARDKVRTVYSGVDLQTYFPDWTSEGKQLKERVRSELNLKNQKVILFVGRLSKVKGPHILLQAMPEILERHPDTVMVFIGSKWFGDNEVNNYVRHLYTLGAMYPDNVQFIQFVQPKNIPTLYAMSDIFVCSSQWQEPLARVHYEAMACGLPIITSNRGGNPEVIDEGRNGRVIKNFEDPLAYAEAINSMLDSSGKREEMGRYGRSKAEREFSWNTVAGNLLRVYENGR